MEESERESLMDQGGLQTPVRLKERGERKDQRALAGGGVAGGNGAGGYPWPDPVRELMLRHSPGGNERAGRVGGARRCSGVIVRETEDVNFSPYYSFSHRPTILLKSEHPDEN